MRINILSKNQIFVIDPAGATKNNCECGDEAFFILNIYGHYIDLCPDCLAKVGKTVIDGLT